MSFDQKSRSYFHSPLLTALVSIGSVTYAGCAGQVDTSSTQSQSESISADAGAGGAALAGCLTTYVGCVRAGDDVRVCRENLRACLPPPPHPGGPMGHGDCDGDGGPPRPPPPLDGDGGPPPPPDGDAGPPPPPDGPRACLDAADTCAHGSDAIDVCVTATVACFPPPPDHRPGDHGPGPGPGAPPPR